MTETTADQELVLYEIRDNVAVLTFNRPDRLNAWTDALEHRYFELLEEAEADPAVRAVVVTGAGRGFCAGADMDALKETTDDLEAAAAIERPPRTRPLDLRMPLVGAVNGAAAGLGLVEALFCDVRFTIPSAKFITAFAQRGLIAEYGISWLLPRIVGRGVALDMLLSSRTVEGDEALRLGLVNRVVEPEALLDETVAYAQRLAALCSPTSMAVIKDQVSRHMDATFADALEESDALMRRFFEAPDVKEGVASYMEKRPPDFAPLAARQEVVL